MSKLPNPARNNELEFEIVRAMIHFEKEFMGRGPVDTRAYLLDDMILVRLKGVLTPAEKKLSETQSDRSAYLLKQVRNELLTSGRPLLEAVIQDIVGVPVRSVHTDICVNSGERVFVFSLARSPMLAQEEATPSGSNGRNGSTRQPADRFVSRAIAENDIASPADSSPSTPH